jgi:hypothetical protein
VATATGTEPTQADMDAAAAEAAANGDTGGFTSNAPYGSSQYWSDKLAALDSEYSNIQAEIAADPDMAGMYQTRLGQLQTAMNQAGTQYRNALRDEQSGGNSSTAMTAYQQASINQGEASRQTQLEIQRMSDAIRRGELQFQQAQATFNNNLANQKAAMEASKWAVPEGMQYFPQFGPGESMAVGNKLLGAKFTPIDVQRMRYTPVQLPSPIDFSTYGQSPGGGGGVSAGTANPQWSNPNWSSPQATPPTPDGVNYNDPYGQGFVPSSADQAYYGYQGDTTGRIAGLTPVPTPYGTPTPEDPYGQGFIPSSSDRAYYSNAPAQPAIGPGAGSNDVGNYPWGSQVPAPWSGVANAAQSIYNIPGMVWNTLTGQWQSAR